MTGNTGLHAVAEALAFQLDAYLNGDRTRWRVSQIEGALYNAEALAESMEWFDELEYAASIFNPGGGPEYMDEDRFGGVAGMARGELTQRFGI